MSDYQFNSLEDFIQYCNNAYSNCNNDKCDNCKFGSKHAEASESERCADSDIPGGFQDMDPQLLIIGTSLLGAILAGKMPFNVQNIVGNWLELLGQTILVFNCQQQYFQSGPGRVYSPIYRNSANPFCHDPHDETQQNPFNNSTSSNYTTSNQDLETFRNTINELHNEVKNLRKEIDKLKNSH